MKQIPLKVDGHPVQVVVTREDDSTVSVQVVPEVVGQMDDAVMLKHATQVLAGWFMTTHDEYEEQARELETARGVVECFVRAQLTGERFLRPEIDEVKRVIGEVKFEGLVQEFVDTRETRKDLADWASGNCPDCEFTRDECACSVEDDAATETGEGVQRSRARQPIRRRREARKGRRHR